MNSPSSLGGFLAVALFLWMLARNGLALFRSLRLARQARSWPRIGGRIVSAGAAERKIQTATIFVPQVEYEFVLNGKTWKGNNILFGEPLPTTREKALAEAARYLENPEVEITYDPKAPETSALRPEAGIFVPALWVGISLAVFALIGGVWLFVPD